MISINIYETGKGTYLKLLNDNIMKTYRKSNNTVYRKVYEQANEIANSYEKAI